MKYQNPQILYFLFALAIPIIIHLFNLRKDKIVYFSDVKFLYQIFTSKKNKKKLYKIILLISRLFAISSVIIAFSQPYISSNIKLDNKNIILYIDNSFSTEDITEDGRKLDIFKQKSIEIIENSKNNAKFWILTNSFSSNENLMKNKERSIEYIQEIKSINIERNKKEVVDKSKTLTNEKSTLFIISDFQKTSTNLYDMSTNDSLINIIFVYTTGGYSENISIDTSYIESPISLIGNTTEIITEITNNGGNNRDNITISLILNDILKTQKITNLLPYQKKKIKLDFVIDNKKTNKGVISIEDFPIKYDNQLFFSISLQEEINITQIYGIENKNISKLYEDDEIINYNKESINNIDYNSLEKQNLIILNGIKEFNSGFISYINNFIKSGGTVCIIPAENVNINNYNNFLVKLNLEKFDEKEELELKISKINIKHNIFNNVFKNNKIEDNIYLPSIYSYYTYKPKYNIVKENIFKLENGKEFLNEYPKEKGRVFLFSSSLTEKNPFTKHSLFVTTFYNMSLHSLKTNKLYYNINGDEKIEIPTNNIKSKEIYHLKSKYSDIICEHVKGEYIEYLSHHNQIINEGHYELTKEDDLIDNISFNYNRNESNLENYTKNEILKFINKKETNNIHLFKENLTIENNIDKLSSSEDLWKYFILIALVFFGLEILIIKKIKNEVTY
tara:strand:+ start:9086 stop:11116 length:2031 start_codon:yes stop_codon:yes gene_type:complete